MTTLPPIRHGHGAGGDEGYHSPNDLPNASYHAMRAIFALEIDVRAHRLCVALGVGMRVCKNFMHCVGLRGPRACARSSVCAWLDDSVRKQNTRMRMQPTSTYGTRSCGVIECSAQRIKMWLDHPPDGKGGREYEMIN